MWLSRRLAATATAVVIAGGFGAASWADTGKCDKISSVPAVISSPGVYCLDRPLTFTVAIGAAITIASDDVTLDLAGFTLAGQTRVATHATGISAVNRHNITVRDGTVRGFEKGILLNGGSNHLVERVRAVDNQILGISVIGDHSVARQNQVADTPGRPGSPPGALAVLGDGGRAVDNDVFGFVGREAGEVTETGWGIGVAGQGVVVHGNRVGTPSGSGPTIGVTVLQGGSALVTDNRITGVESGIEALDGTLKCYNNIFFGPSLPPACDQQGNNF